MYISERSFLYFSGFTPKTALPPQTLLPGETSVKVLAGIFLGKRHFSSVMMTDLGDTFAPFAPVRQPQKSSVSL